MNEGDSPKDCTAQLDRYGKLCGRVAVRCFQAEVAEDLPWTLVEQAEENSEGNVVDQATADEGGGAVLGPRVHMAIRDALPDGRATAPQPLSADKMAALHVLLIVKPYPPVVLQVVIDG